MKRASFIARSYFDIFVPLYQHDRKLQHHRYILHSNDITIKMTFGLLEQNVNILNNLRQLWKSHFNATILVTPV